MKHAAPFVLAVALSASPFTFAQEPFPPAGPSSHSDEAVFLGFTWFTGGESALPEIELGYRYADVDSGGDTDGYGASVSFNLGAGAFDKIRLVGLYGKEDWQGEAGGGYSFVQGQPFGLLGVRGKHVYLGGELGINGVPVFGAGAHTLGEFDEPSQSGGLLPPPPPPNQFPIE